MNISHRFPQSVNIFHYLYDFLLLSGVIFEIPIFMVFLSKIGLINVAFLNKNRKYALLINFIIAAILTPTPDIVNQLMMAGPLIVLYELSVLAVWLFGRKKFKDFSEVEKQS